jgi:hypothetical protein
MVGDSSPLFTGAFADPFDDFFAPGLAGRDPLHQTSVGVDGWRPPSQAICIQKPRGDAAMSM